MARLTFFAITSLDGYVVDDRGSFDWAMPDDEVHAFVNDLVRPVSTYLYGRRMYEVMSWWESPDLSTGQPPVIQDFARLWRSADKVVYSTTLKSVPTARTRIERVLSADGVQALKDESSGDLAVGGPTLAAHAIAADLVDDYQLVLAPVVVGGGTAALPRGVRRGLELADERRFGNGMVYLHYQAASR